MRSTPGNQRDPLRAQLVIVAALLTLLDTALSSAATRERRGVGFRSEFRPLQRLYDSGINNEHGGSSRSDSRAKRSTSDIISIENGFPEINAEAASPSLEVADENIDIKRRWSSGRNMAVWGKRDANNDIIDDVTDEEKRKWGGDRKMAVWGKRDASDKEDEKRKWKNDQRMAVWGKRFAAENYPSEAKRKWRNGNRMELWGKRKWLSRNMAVWGKRSLDDDEIENLLGSEDEKRAWRGRDMAVWG